MSRIATCKTCGRLMAESADACPHCGAPNRKSVWGTLGCLWLVVMFGMLAPRTCKPPPEKPEPPPLTQEQKDANAIDLFRKATAFNGCPVTMRIRIWDGLRDYRKGSFRELRTEWAPVRTKNGVAFDVRTEYTYQNHFGDTLTGHARMLLHGNGHIYDDNFTGVFDGEPVIPVTAP